MANTLGTLIVRLGLDAAEFISGMTKSEREAQKFAERLDKGITAGAKAAGVALGAIVAGATAAAVAIDQLVKQAGNFQDLAEKTGANAEALASFAVSAEVAGVGIESVAAASVKLTKNLSDAEGESKGVGKALAAIGIPIKELKQLDPATQIEEIAKALSGFEDGATKTAVAIELFGKSGADLLPFLKELASQGGRQVILTAEQIRQADEYADKQARAIAEVKLHAQAIATQFLPAVTNVVNAVKTFVSGLVDIDSNAKKLRNDTSITEWANAAALKIATVVDAAQAVSRIFLIVGESIAARAAQLSALASGDLQRVSAIGEDAQRRIQAIASAPLFSQTLAKTIDEANKEARLRAQEDRGFTPAGRQIKFSGADDGKKEKEKTSEAQRYLDALDRQLEKTQELSAAEQVWLDFSLGRIKGMTGAQFELAVKKAQQVDLNKQLKKSEEDHARAQQEAQRLAERDEEIVRRSGEAAQREAEAVREGNRSLEEQLVFLQGGQQALDALTDAREADIIAQKENTLAIAESLSLGEKVIAGLKAEIAARREKQRIVGDIRVAEQVAKELEAVRQAQSTLFDIGANAIENLVLNGAKLSDVLRQLERDLLRFAMSESLKAIKKALIPDANSGPTLFDVLAKLIGAGVSAYAGGGGGGGFIEGPQFGGYARGTQYAAGGLSWVGEHGPELRYIPRGAAVIPNLQARSMGGGSTNTTVNQYMSVPPGAPTSTIRQEARRGLGLGMAQSRRG